MRRWTSRSWWGRASRPSLVIGLCLSLLACAPAKENGSQAQRQRPAVAVKAAQAAVKDLPVVLTAVGNVEPVANVAVKAKVTSQVVQVHFTEGQDVGEGDLLFTLDKAPFEVTLRENQAKLARDQALAKKAQADVVRNATLAQKDFLSQQNYEQLKATAESLEATVKADQAAVDASLLQLSYCALKAPLAGRTGGLMAFRGSQVKAYDDNKSLVVINQIKPIYVNFAVPESRLAEINRAKAAQTLAVAAVIPDKDGGGGAPLQGVLSFIDNAVDAKTGTIRLKGTFANEEKRLWPGQFVSVVLTLGVERGVVVVPDQAVQTGQAGLYVYVVKPDKTVELRPVTVGRSLGGETVVAQGLQAGETVVVDGQLLLVPGARVTLPGETTDRSPGGPPPPAQERAPQGPAQPGRAG